MNEKFNEFVLRCDFIYFQNFFSPKINIFPIVVRSNGLDSFFFF